MSEIKWINGKMKVIFTKEEKREIRRKSINSAIHNKRFWVL